MYKLKTAKKILTFITCSVMTAGLITAFPSLTVNNNAQAKTLAEIQEQRKSNDEKIAALENQITGLEGNKEQEKQQQAYLTEQIGYIQENINLLNVELETLNNDIANAEINIQNLDVDIIEQQNEIDENIELFKQRLCSMYMSSNDSAASVVLGSTSFYDMMSRVQMINRVAEYDDQLIDDILTEIDNLEKTKKDLEAEKLNLTMKVEEQEKRREEKASEIEQLNIKMADTQYEIERIAMEQKSLERSKEEIAQQNEELDKEEDFIKAEIKRQQEEAQRRWEEEQRRKAEEAAKKAAEEVARKKAEEAAARKKAEEEAAKKAAEEAARKKAEEEAAARKKAEEEARRKAEEEAKQTNPPQTNSTTAPTTAIPATVATTIATTVTEPPQTTTYVVPTVAESGFAWPAPGFSYISSYFGSRWGRNHNGIDIGDAGIMGGSAIASQSGTVITVNNNCTHNYAKSSSCGCGGGYGNYVVISHDGTYSTLYGHLSYASVSVGDYVEQGQVIGAIGSTGFSTGAHLHFEVRVNGSPQNPSNYVNP